MQHSLFLGPIIFSTFAQNIEIMPTRVQVEKDIKEYCKLNGITDISHFTTMCMMRGLYVFKYGTSPVDNITRQNGKTQENTGIAEEEPVVIKKKRISVTKKKESGKAD